MLATLPEARALYLAACFAPATRARLPKMRVSLLCADATLPFALVALAAVRADDAARGGGLVACEVVPGANHFIHWDDPPRALALFRRCVLEV
ncbi:hypothetical protein OF83DRAFT_1170157 [Amylostereum chailletii]|nr:hypothetical protein OF83DRAFT_1170157 [Amylostereum chailletii]